MKENALRLVQTLFLLAKRHAFALVVICLGLVLFTSRYQLAINFTESLPGTVFLIDKKDRRVQKGEPPPFPMVSRLSNAWRVFRASAFT